MLILSSTRQRSRICDFLSTLTERRYFDVVLCHLNVVIRRRNDVVQRRYRQLPIDRNVIIEMNGKSYVNKIVL
jgi:hypothetical protein